MATRTAGQRSPRPQASPARARRWGDDARPVRAQPRPRSDDPAVDEERRLSGNTRHRLSLRRPRRPLQAARRKPPDRLHVPPLRGRRGGDGRPARDVLAPHRSADGRQRGRKNGRKWLVEPFDLVTAAQLWRSGDLRPRHWLRSLRGVEETAWLAADDPGRSPAMVARSTRRFVRRARSILQPGRGRGIAGLAAVVVLGGLLVAPADAATAPPAAHRPGVVLVGFEPRLSAAERRGIESAAGSARRSRTLVSAARFAAAGRGLRGVGPLTRLRMKPGSERRVVRRLSGSAGVRFAELDYLMSEDAAPDDPGWASGAFRTPARPPTGRPGSRGRTSTRCPPGTIRRGRRTWSSASSTPASTTTIRTWRRTCGPTLAGSAAVRPAPTGLMWSRAPATRWTTRRSSAATARTWQGSRARSVTTASASPGSTGSRRSCR